MNHILIGDVHGCLTELEALWQRLPLTQKSEIIFLGDLIDKGPDSDGVLNFVYQQSQKHTVVLVLGNHEAKALRQYPKGLPVSFTPTKANQALLHAMVPYHSFAQGRFLAVHAGIYPAFWKHCPALPSLEEIPFSSRKLQDQIRRFVFCRYVNPVGHIVALGTEQPADRFWAELYDGRVGTIFFGHQPYLEGVHSYQYAYGMDTGCVFGGSLTAAVITDAEITWIQEPARQAYAQVYV